MTSAVSHSPLARRLAAALALPAFFLLVYCVAVRPSQLRWGATPGEAARPMPGDELVAHPTFSATRAITIRALPEQIWPWLVQMGYNRAGFYGYDLIENVGSVRGIRSAASIVPELQSPQPGELLPISRVAHLVFGPMQPHEYLIWRSEANPADGAFTWALYPIDDTHTRLVSRIRFRYHWSQPWLLTLDLFTEFADPLAVPKLLHGIRDRAEGRAPEPLAPEIIEFAIWAVAILQFAFAIRAVIRDPSRGRIWLCASLAGSALLLVFYAHAPLWMEAALVCTSPTLALVSRARR